MNEKIERKKEREYEREREREREREMDKAEETNWKRTTLREREKE